MSIILGSATIVSVGGNADGIISAQWGISPQVNRLWQLGHWQPYKTTVVNIRNVSLTMYAGAGPTIPALSPAASCTNSTAKMTVVITPAGCGEGISALGGTFEVYLSSYSYDKGDAVGFGQQSYAGQEWVDDVTNEEDAIIYLGAPTHVLQGISEGTITADDGLDTGVTFDTSWNVEGTQGNISAGSPGIGQANTTIYGIATNIDNGDLVARGLVGQASVNITHTPIYMG
jgi:hypothetical protein